MAPKGGLEMEGFMAESDVAVAGAPESVSDRLSDSDRNTIRQFGRILSVGKGFLGLSSYSKERSFLRSLKNANGDGPSQQEFLAFFTEQTTSDFWKIAKPKVQAQELSEIIARFEQKKRYEAYREELKSELSPQNNAQLQAHIDKLGNVSDKVKMAAARGFVFGDLSEAYETSLKQSGIGRFGNLWHTTLGRNVAAPIKRLLQPIGSHMQAFQATAGAWGKVLGLSVAGGIAFWAAAALLFPVSALGAVGAALCACGGVAIASQMPGAFKKLGQVQAKAEAARMQRDGTFAEKNKEYRLGRDFSQDNSLEKSMIVIEGIQEHHFAGKAHLNVATGQVMLPENMHLSYAGFATLAFDRKTEQLRITLNNADGLTAEQNAKMIKEIVTACTGQDIKKSVVLGKSCNGFDEMKTALEANKEAIFQNRLAELKDRLNAEMDTVLSKALVHPASRDSASGGIADYVTTALDVLGVRREADERLYDQLTTEVQTPLEAALRELTGKQNITFAGANPVTTAATQIMANAIPNYEKLTENQQKLALVNFALGGGVPKELAAYGNTLATAAAIAATGSGVTEKQFEKVAKIRNGMGESPNNSARARAGTEILKTLGIRLGNNTSKEDRQAFGEIAQGILQSNGSVSAEALQVVAAQTQTATARV
jgi:hypothetical protein